MKLRVCEICLGRRGGSSYGEGGRRGMRNCCPTTSQIQGPTEMGFCFDGKEFFFQTVSLISKGTIFAEIHTDVVYPKKTNSMQFLS